MKITLSKTQWQLIGKQAGWLKKATQIGENYIETSVYLEPVWDSEGLNQIEPIKEIPVYAMLEEADGKLYVRDSDIMLGEPVTYNGRSVAANEAAPREWLPHMSTDDNWASGILHDEIPSPKDIGQAHDRLIHELQQKLMSEISRQNEPYREGK